MIVNCHTHVWESAEQLGAGSAAYLRRQTGKASLSAEPQEHFASSECVDKAFVLGFVSRLTGAEIPNRLIEEYVAQHPEKLIGFAGLDPMAEDAFDRLEEAAEKKAFRGITVSPAAQDFHPGHSRMQRVYEFCSERRLVMLVHQGTHFAAESRMEYARPYLWDEVLRDFPSLTLIIAHLGHPWVDETLTLLGKHPRAYADIAGLLRRPWHAYNCLVNAHQFQVTDKLLFGSDFPYLKAKEAIETLYRINEVAHGTMLPSVPREVLRGIVEREAMSLLGIE